jgi:excisionase family DNA binding protein
VNKEAEGIKKFGKLMSVSEAQEYLGIGRTTMYKLMDDGRIGIVRINTRILIPVEELDRFVTESYRPATN